jgi:predicted nucleic acid-binding protein
LSLLVLDASVAILWAVPPASNPLTEPSLRLLRSYVERDVEFVVPDLFWAEVANALCKGARQKRWRREDAEEGIRDLSEYDFETVSSVSLMEEAVPIALKFGISLYDCLYVALAFQGKIELITADERLVNALATRFPVKWLGAL